MTMDSKEVEAASVEEATQEALEQLGAREDEVTIEVVATPRAGVLGLGARQARVRVTRKDAAGAGAIRRRRLKRRRQGQQDKRRKLASAQRRRSGRAWPRTRESAAGAQ